MSPNHELPLVSIILPIRNEARFIERCLEAVLAQDYPRDCLEILIADGMSTDGTRTLIQKTLERSALGVARRLNVQVLDNVQGIVPTGLNLAIRASYGDVILRVDGHTKIEHDYVSRCVAALEQSGADNVGGPMRAISDTRVGKAIAMAMSSPFGVGNAQFHYAEEAMWVDTVYLGAFRREVFDRVGLFDPELVRNQDDEFNFRLTRAGGKIWLDPQVRSVYYSRNTLHGLWKQFFEYGFWKVRVIQKHRRPASMRHLVPLIFVVALVVSALASLGLRSPLWFGGVVLPYLAAALLASVLLAARNGWSYIPILLIVFPTMHVAYGSGFLLGVAQFGFAQHSAGVPVSPSAN